MAIDPTQIAEQQEQQERITAVGAPTEFAKGPEREGDVEIAGFGRDLMKSIMSEFNKPPPPVESIIKTPQETPLLDETIDPEQLKKEKAAETLSPEGYEEFEKRGFTAKPTETAEAVRAAKEAIDEVKAADLDPVNEINKQTDKPEYNQVIDNANKAIEGEVPEVSPLEEVVLPNIEVEAKSIAEGGDFNLENMKTSDDVGKLITAVSEVSKLEISQAKRFKIPNNVTKENAAALLADELGFTERFLNRRIEDGLLLGEELVAAREIFVVQGEKIMNLADKINTGVSTSGEKLEFRRQLAIYHGFHMHLKGFQTETARALQSFGIEVGGEDGALALAGRAREALEQLGGGEGITDDIAKAAASVVQEKGFKGLNRFINKVVFAKTRAAIAEAYMAGLLTSPATNFKNIISNALWMTYQLPTETLAGIYGTGIRSVRQARGLPIDPEQVYIEDTALRVKGWLDSFGDALKVASIAFKSEKPSIKARAEIEDYSTGFRLADETPLSGPINFIFKGVRLPFRALLFGDEFFKTISQRGELYVQSNRAYRKALYDGKDPIEAMDEAGMVLLDPDSVAKELDQTAKYNTLQDDTEIFGLDISAPGTAIQKISLGPIPVGKWLMPFVKTPTSAAIKSMEMSGINPQVYKDLFTGTPAQQQKAMAKITMAGASFAYVQNKVAEGRMTGAMPMDKVAREALPPGWQPYSFVFKGEGWPEGVDKLYNDMGIPNGPLMYVSYSGWEPVGGVLAFMTTANEAVYGNDVEGFGNRALAAVGSIANYYAELPMLQGLSDISTILDNDSFADMFRDAPHLFRGPIEGSTIGGFPNVWAAAQRMGFRVEDPTVRNPYGDFDYYTMEDVTQTNPDGTFKYLHPNGTDPDYRLVGRAKLGIAVRGGQPHIAEEMSMLLDKIKSMRAKDSFFQEEEDYNAVKRDTLGRAYGSEDVSFATNPYMALWNNFTGIRMRPAEKPTNVEIELMRLHGSNNAWALSNPKSYNGMKLSFRAQMDLVNEAKNIQRDNIPGLGGMVTFQEALENLTTRTNTRQGRLYADDMRKTGESDLSMDAKRFYLIKDLEKKFYDKAWRVLMTDPSYQSIPYYAKLRQAFDDREAASNKIKEKGMLTR